MRVVFTALIVLYLALDFGDILLPGANAFDIGESVEVVQLQRDPSPQPREFAVTPEPLARLERHAVRVSPPPASYHRRRGAGLPRPVHSAIRHVAADPSVSEEG